jgi:C4-dicarboxylate-specific signal transduction histidine kinase
VFITSGAGGNFAANFMESRSDETPPFEKALPADRLIRRLAGRYLFVFAVVAGLVVVDQVIIQPSLVRLSWYAPIINVAGRQRMLSQKLTKAALALQTAEDDQHRQARREELRDTIQQWSRAYSALREGNHELGIPRIQSGAIEHEWTQLAPHFVAMCTAVEAILRTPKGWGDDRLSAATSTIVAHEAAFLTSMDRIVKLMENEAAAAVFRLRVCAATIAAAVMVLLTALGWFVIRPATHTIRSQVDELESQVAARTRELTAALNALQYEAAQRERAEVKTQRLAAQLAHAGRVSTMGHLTAGLAHELNQPLATIANYAEASDVELSRFANDAQTARLRKHLYLAKQAALRAGQIVRRMRNFLRPNSLTTTEVEISSLIREVAELCHTEADHAGAEVLLDFADEEAAVLVDPIQIQQVLINLVQNALQAMREGSIQRRLVISTSVSADIVQVDVTDSGPGFTSTDSEVVFAPFYTTKREGLGIGLSICRAIVEEHGGTIRAEAAPGRGAKVSFTLPLAEQNAESRRTQPECVCR